MNQNEYKRIIAEKNKQKKLKQNALYKPTIQQKNAQKYLGNYISEHEILEKFADLEKNAKKQREYQIKQKEKLELQQESLKIKQSTAFLIHCNQTIYQTEIDLIYNQQKQQQKQYKQHQAVLKSKQNKDNNEQINQFCINSYNNNKNQYERYKNNITDGKVSFNLDKYDLNTIQIYRKNVLNEYLNKKKQEKINFLQERKQNIKKFDGRFKKDQSFRNQGIEFYHEWYQKN